MNNKHVKLKEAKYFLEKMQKNKGNQCDFNHTLSAFLTAARSVMQYIYKEVKYHNDSRLWYGRTVSSDRDLSNLTGLRNKNIHEEPISTTKHAFSNGTRCHYFKTQSTQEDVLIVSQRLVNSISHLLEDGANEDHIS